MSKELTCFKAYDVRGELGLNLNGDICYRIGRAYAEVMECKTVIIGRDVRKSSPELSKCFSEDLARMYYEKNQIETACLRIASCAPVTTKRGLASWLSYNDLILLVKSAIESKFIGFSILY